MTSERLKAWNDLIIAVTSIHGENKDQCIGNLAMQVIEQREHVAALRAQLADERAYSVALRAEYLAVVKGEGGA